VERNTGYILNNEKFTRPHAGRGMWQDDTLESPQVSVSLQEIRSAWWQSALLLKECS